MIDFSNINKEKKYFIFNINSSSITGSLVYFNFEKQKSVIEYTTTKIFPIEKNLSINVFKKNTSEGLKSILEDLLNYLNISNNFSSINEFFIFLSPPWNRKRMSVLIDERIEPFFVSNDYLENFLSKVEEEAETEELLSSEIFSIKANGYEVLLKEVMGKKISKLEISLMNNYFDISDKIFFQEIIESYIPSIKINFSSFLPVFLGQVKKIYNTNNDFVFMNFTGEVMEFGIFQNRQIKGIFSLELGKNQIIREIFKNKITDNIKEAEYLLSSYLRGEIENKWRFKIEIILMKISEIINSKIELELEKEGLEQIPAKTFVVSAGAMNKLLDNMNIFEETYFIGRSFLKQMVLAEDDKYFDNFIALESIYIFNS